MGRQGGRNQHQQVLCLTLTLVGVSVAMTHDPAEASAAPALASESSALARAYDDHPLVRETLDARMLTLLARERALSDALPLDRALAVIDAVGAASVRRLDLAASMARALRARHGVGPSGALLGKPIPYGELSGREALLLGWTRAMEAGGNGAQLARAGANIADAGALALLTHAVAKEPNKQAPALALALARAAAVTGEGKGKGKGKGKGSSACAAYQAVQAAARDGKGESVRLAAAEAAIASVAALARSCSKTERNAFARPLSLPPPVAEAVTAVAASSGPPRPPRPTERSSYYQKGIAWTVMAPVFKGYLDDPLVGQLVRTTRLDEVLLVGQLERDPTGDLSIAALNASVLMRRVDFDDNLELAWLAIVRRHGLLDAPPDRVRALALTALSGPEAMVLAYAKAIAGLGDAPPQTAPAITAFAATPRQLFAYGRQRTPGNAVLGPMMQIAHDVDRERANAVCAGGAKAENAAFVAGKAQLPPAAREALIQAMRMVEGECRQSAGGSAKP